MFFAKPVAEVSRPYIDAFSKIDADSADGNATNINSPVGGFSHCGKQREPTLRIGAGEGMRESVMKISPNVPIVGSGDQSCFVAALPVSNSTPITLDSHRRHHQDVECQAKRRERVSALAR